MGPPEQKQRGRKPKKDTEKAKKAVAAKAKVSHKPKVSPKSKAKASAKPKAEPKPKTKRVLTDEQKRINSKRSAAYHKAQREAKRAGCDAEETKRRAREVQDTTFSLCMHV